MKSLLVAALTLVSLSAHAYTDAQGKEWRKLNETMGYTAEQARAVCNPVCSSNLFGYTWANQSEVQSLLNEFSNGADMSDPLTGFSIGQNFVSQFGATWSLSLTTSYYAVSQGRTSSVDANGSSIIGQGNHGTNGTGAGTSGGVSLGAVADESTLVGGIGLFLYKSSVVTPTPTPVPTPVPTPSPTPAPQVPVCNKKCQKVKKEAAKQAAELAEALLKKEREAAKKKSK